MLGGGGSGGGAQTAILPPPPPRPAVTLSCGLLDWRIELLLSVGGLAVRGPGLHPPKPPKALLRSDGHDLGAGRMGALHTPLQCTSLTPCARPPLFVPLSPRPPCRCAQGNWIAAGPALPDPTPKAWYLTPGGGLSESAPATPAAAAFLYDPADPVRTRGGCIMGAAPGQGDQKHAIPCGPWDQLPVTEGRRDVLTYTSAALPEDMAITGTGPGGGGSTVKALQAMYTGGSAEHRGGQDPLRGGVWGGRGVRSFSQLRNFPTFGLLRVQTLQVLVAVIPTSSCDRSGEGGEDWAPQVCASDFPQLPFARPPCVPLDALCVPCAEVVLREAAGGLVTALQFPRKFSQLDLTPP